MGRQPSLNHMQYVRREVYQAQCMKYEVSTDCVKCLLDLETAE